MKISGKITSNNSTELNEILEVLQNVTFCGQILVFKGTEKEAIVNLNDGTYTMRPFGTVLLELLNDSAKIGHIIENVFTSDDFDSTYNDNYTLSFVEAFEKQMKKILKEKYTNKRVSVKDYKNMALLDYIKCIESFTNIFLNQKDFYLLQTPSCMTIKASRFVIPFSKNLQKGSYLDIYVYDSISSIFGVYAKIFYENKIPFKKCKNCGKYFIPLHKSNETLCNNKFKNGKTCKELSGEIKLSNDEILSIYRTAYKRENGKKNRYRHIPNIQLKFENWNKIAKEKYLDCQNGTISKEELSDWLNSSRDWHKD